jgi:hypothetical protein
MIVKKCATHGGISEINSKDNTVKSTNINLAFFHQTEILVLTLTPPSLYDYPFFVKGVLVDSLLINQ